MPRPALAPQVDLLDAFVELISQVESGPTTEFYGRLCEAVCRLTSMERAALFLYDESLGYVRPVGSHGVDPSGLEHVHGTLDETPIAQRALSLDRVLETSEEEPGDIPARYAGVLGITTLTCTPVSAGGRWLGVVFADRGGGHFAITDEERHVMWTLGKLAALAASARIATRQQERAHRLAEQIDLAREVHERVMHRLFGVSLALDTGEGLAPADRERCREELREALGDLRTMLERPLGAKPPATATTLMAELSRLQERGSQLPVQVFLHGNDGVPPDVEPLAQSVLAEALRNAARHARPSRVQVDVRSGARSFALEVSNDGVHGGQAGTGMGLRLAAFEALQRGGTVEWGPVAPDGWHVRLVVPK